MSRAVLLAVLCAGCAAAPTQVVVRLVTDLPIPEEFDGIRLEIVDGDGTIVREQDVRGFDPTLDDGAFHELATFGLVPRGGEAGRRFEVRATALRGTTPLFVTRARSSFLDEQTIRLDLYLPRLCVELAATCQPDETCGITGCVDPNIDPTTLPSYEERPPTDPVDPRVGEDGTLWIFRTDVGYDGNLGGIPGADANCAARATALGYPGTYRAMLGNNTVNPRIACFNPNCSPVDGRDGTDWVLRANTTYVRAEDGATIGTTTSNRIFTFPLTNAFSSDPTADTRAWTYIATDWTPQEIGFSPPGVKCVEWTSSSGADQGMVANVTSASTGSDTLYAGISEPCDWLRRLVCVRQ